MAFLNLGASLVLFRLDALADENGVHENEERNEFHQSREEVADCECRDHIFLVGICRSKLTD